MDDAKLKEMIDLFEESRTWNKEMLNHCDGLWLLLREHWFACREGRVSKCDKCGQDIVSPKSNKLEVSA